MTQKPQGPRLRISMLGTRGVPATYGGFETAVEEIGARLAERGHRVTVYCRSGSGTGRRWRGMHLVPVGALHLKSAETLSRTALSVAHLTFARHPDVAFVFNAANSPFVPWLRLMRVPTVVHVDGLEWMRDKWSGAGKRYYRFAERFAVRHADALIADAAGIADYYERTYSAGTELIAYGAPIIEDAASGLIRGLDLEPGGYHLVVARFEPENHVDVIVEGYHQSAARLPLVVVGSAPYAAQHIAAIEGVAARDSRIRLLGSVWDQQLLDELYANAATYVHGHSVGGTNPSLLRAMGAGADIVAWDVNFNREVAGADGSYFSTAEELARRLEQTEAEPQEAAHRGHRQQQRARALYSWDDVADRYENLAIRLHAGTTVLSHQTRNLTNHNPEMTRS